MKYFRYILLALIVYFAVFWNLDYMPIRLWDESRLAINAFEMYKNGNFIVTFFNGSPDMWNTKPPLMIWFQVGMFKLFGVSVFSFRFMSAFATLLTAIVILIFSEKTFKTFWLGFIAVLVLISIDGFIDLHSSRTGDYDALLTFFTTLSGLLFYMYIEYKKDKYLMLFFVFLMLAVMTKGIAGLLFLPGLLLYTIWKKQFKSILKNKHFYIGIAIFLIPVVTYYLAREYYNPGFLSAVFENEIGGRYFKPENYNNDFLFYFKRLTRMRLVPWYLFIPVGILFGMISKNIRVQSFTVFLVMMIFPFWLIISFSKTKLIWYDVPTYPFVAMLIAVFLYEVILILQKKEIFKNSILNLMIPYLFVFSIVAIPYLKIIKKNIRPQDYVSEKGAFELGSYLRDGTKGIIDLDGYTTVYSGYRPQIDFYHRILNRNGISIKFKDWDKLKQGDKVLVVQEDDKNKIEMKYSFTILYTKDDFTIYSIE